MRVLVIGAGAVGGYFGGLLARAGHEVTFGVRARTLAALRAHGIRLYGPRGDWQIREVEATDDALRVPTVDVALSCVKLYDVESSAQQWAPALDAAGAVISLQNGIDGAERIAVQVPGANVFGGLAFVAGRLEEPGLIRYLSDMSSIVFGGPGATECEPLRRFAEAVNGAKGPTPLHAKLVEDVRSAQWAKFVALATNASLTCLTRKPAGVVYHDPDLLELARQSIAEAIAVGRADGVVFSPSQAHDSLHMLQNFPPDLYASMHHDLAAGGRLELDGLSGLLVRLGRRHGVPTPFHEFAYACLKPYMNGRQETP